MRSNAEQTFARWMKANDVEFEYEVKTFTLPSGERYTPDFWLPASGQFIEVKAGQIERLHKPWITAWALSRTEEPELQLFLWSYGRLRRARKIGWSPDVGWVKCEECSITQVSPNHQHMTCRACGGTRLGYVPLELRSEKFRRRDPVATWRPSADNQRDAGLRVVTSFPKVEEEDLEHDTVDDSLPPTEMFLEHGFGFRWGEHHRDCRRLVWRLCHRGLTEREIVAVLYHTYVHTPSGQITWQEIAEIGKSGLRDWQREREVQRQEMLAVLRAWSR